MLEEDRKETVKQIEKAVKYEQERAKVSAVVMSSLRLVSTIMVKSSCDTKRKSLTQLPVIEYFYQTNALFDAFFVVILSLSPIQWCMIVF